MREHAPPKPNPKDAIRLPPKPRGPLRLELILLGLLHHQLPQLGTTTALQVLSALTGRGAHVQAH